jgi:hypothetical protein
MLDLGLLKLSALGSAAVFLSALTDASTTAGIGLEFVPLNTTLYSATNTTV